MIRILDDRTITQLGTFERWTLVHIQVRQGIVRMASAATDLEDRDRGISTSGLTIPTSADVVSLWWIGPLFLRGAVTDPQALSQTIADFQLMEGTPK